VNLLSGNVFVQLNRATVQNAVTGKLETASYRVSKRLVATYADVTVEELEALILLPCCRIGEIKNTVVPVLLCTSVGYG